MCAYEATVGKSRAKAQKEKPRLRFVWRSALHKAREPESQNLLAVALVGLFLGFWTVHRYDLGWPGIVMRVKGYHENPAWQVEAEKRDPKIGRIVKLPAFQSLDGKKMLLPQRQGLTFLAFTGNCTACATRDNMVSTEALARRFPKVNFYIVIMTGDAKAARAIWQASHIAVPLVVDRDGEAAVRLNSIFNFRRYLFDSQGRLIYLSRRNQSADEVARDIEDTISAKAKAGGQ